MFKKLAHITNTRLLSGMTGMLIILSVLTITSCQKESDMENLPIELKSGRLTAQTATPDGNSTERATFFICPTVSTHSPNGMWVIGGHGAYYVKIPLKGNGSKIYLTIPVTVEQKAQIPAGWGLYKDLPNYPNFEGMAGLLSEGIKWLNNDPRLQEGDMATVMNTGEGTYQVTVVGPTHAEAITITINEPIPLESGVIW